ncbi:hypothetical protein [uncultured Alistipes sp.]|uniref:hypothetical protein n=1 Tax=uncultured Alistipes sp. TaxID=538949 RepID=UPI00272A4930|nr:hypothetical protein [uncultured Alistipes sp.]
MAIRSLNQLKKWFQKGCYPTAAQFADWMDSFFHKDDIIPITSVDGLSERLNDKYNAADGAALEARADAIADDLAAHRAESILDHRSINDNIEHLETEDERLAQLIADETARATEQETAIRSEVAAADAATLADAKAFTTEREEVLRTEQQASDAATLADAKTYADDRLAGVVDGAPEELDTLRKLAEAVGGDPGFAAAVAGQLDTKVDKIEGKGLSTEDFTTADKQALDSLTSGGLIIRCTIPGIE